MNINENILSAIDIIVDKKISDSNATASKLLVAEITSFDILTGKYGVKYQDMYLSGITANNNITYHPGDIVQIITDGNQTSIIDRLSDGSKAVYQKYIAQVSLDNQLSFGSNEESLEKTIYSATNQIYNGITKAEIDAFNDALSTAYNINLIATTKFEGTQSLKPCYLTVYFKSVAYEKDENDKFVEVIKATKKIQVKFEETETHTINDTLDEVVGGIWQLNEITFSRTDKDINPSLLLMYLNVSSNDYSLSDRLIMTLEGSDFIFEASDDPNVSIGKVAQIKDNTGNYFSSNEIRYYWCAEDPTVVEHGRSWLSGNNRYNPLFGPGWYNLTDALESNKYSISIKDIPQTARRIKCVAVYPNLLGAYEPIAEAICEITNAHNPITLAEIQVTYDESAEIKTASLSITPPSENEEYTYYWAKRLDYDSHEYSYVASATNEITDIDIEEINYVNIYCCSIYKKVPNTTEEQYLGTVSKLVYSNPDNEDIGLTGEQKRWACIKGISIEKRNYFKTLEWWSDKKTAQMYAYNGKDVKTTSNGTDALRDISALIEEGNDVAYGYYLWCQSIPTIAEGFTEVTYSLISPDSGRWEKEIKATYNYYIALAAGEEPSLEGLIKVESAPDGHGDRYKLTETQEALSTEGWETDKGAIILNANTPVLHKVSLNVYNSGELEFTKPSIVEIYTATLTGNWEIESIEPWYALKSSDIAPNIKEDGDIWKKLEEEMPQADVWVKMKLTYQDDKNGISYAFTDTATEDSTSGKYKLTYTYAWGNNNIEPPQDGVFGDFTSDRENKPYLWAKSSSGIKKVVGITLGEARKQTEQSGIKYAVNNSNTEIPGEEEWDSDFKATAAKVNDNNTVIWSKIDEEYETFYYTDDVKEYRGYDFNATTPFSQDANDVIVTWCVENDDHIIDGSRFATGSITADKLDVSRLDAMAANIAGWRIGDSALFKGNDIFLSTGIYQSKKDENKDDYQRIAAGGTSQHTAIKTGEYTAVNLQARPPKNATGNDKYKSVFSFSFVPAGDWKTWTFFMIGMDNINEGIGFMPPSPPNSFSNEEVFEINGNKITIKIVPPEGDNIRCEVTGIFEDGGIHTIAWCKIEYKVNVVDGLTNPKFQVLSDGSMYATEGNIAGWTVSDDYLMSPVGTVGDNKYYSIFRSNWKEDASPENYPVLGIGIDSKKNSDAAPFKVMLNGNMYATRGAIAGWVIEKPDNGIGKIYYKRNNSTLGVGLAEVNSSNKDQPVFWAGYSGEGDTPWENKTGLWNEKTAMYISGNGILYAKGAQITGDITATKLIIRDDNDNDTDISVFTDNKIQSANIIAKKLAVGDDGGTLAGWEISGSALTNNNITIQNSYNSKSQGVISLNGAIFVEKTTTMGERPGIALIANNYNDLGQSADICAYVDKYARNNKGVHITPTGIEIISPTELISKVVLDQDGITVATIDGNLTKSWIKLVSAS